MGGGSNPQLEDCMSVTPSMVVPLVDIDGNEYYVRTTMDSG